MAVPQNSPQADTITQKKQRFAIKAKINAWKKQGYLVSELEPLLSGDFEKLQEMFFDYVHDINVLDRCRKELTNLNTEGFEEKVESIEKNIFTPPKADEVHQEFDELKKELMITIKNVPDLTKQQDILRKELERIRKEEIERIKREEVKKIRKNERERLIKEAEKRLRKKEGAKIKKQEKERQTWIRHLKETIPETKKEPTIKHVKTCPSCGQRIPITSDKRPLQIKCENCGKEYTLRGGKEQKNEKPLKRMKCPNCRDIIEIFSNKRPLKVSCGGCGKEFTLKGKHEKREEEQPTPPSITLDDILAKTTKEKKSSLLEMKSYGEADRLSTEIEEKDEIECPHCGSMAPPEFKRCGMCGNLLHEEQPEEKQFEEKIRRPEERSELGIFAPLQKKEDAFLPLGRDEKKGDEFPEIGTQGFVPEKKPDDLERSSFFPDVEEPKSSITKDEKISSFESTDNAPVFKEDRISSEFPEPFITDKKKEKKEELEFDFELPEFTPEKKDEELMSFTPDTSTQAVQQGKTSHCPHCGNEIPEGASFCGGCGKRI